MKWWFFVRGESFFFRFSQTLSLDELSSAKGSRNTFLSTEFIYSLS